MAFVVDEYGSFAGTGDVARRARGRSRDSSVPTRRTGGPFEREDGSWLLDGQIPLTDLAQHLALEWPDASIDEGFEHRSAA